MILLLALFLRLTPIAVQGRAEDRIYPSDYYYDYSNDNSSDAVGEPDDIDDLELSGGNRFVAKLLCSAESMTMLIDRRRLPKGLTLQTTTQINGKDKPPCQHTSHNSTHYIREVPLKCKSAIAEIRTPNSVSYSHEFVLGEDTEQGERKMYTIILVCTKQDAPETEWEPSYRLMEHRRDSECTTGCNAGTLCISAADLTGYFCECSPNTDGCECAAGLYRCSNEYTVKTPRNFVCLNESSVCNSKFDCPFKDDETCENIFEEWSAWSQCNCKTGLKSRRRECKRSFSSGDLRVSRECTLDDESTQQTRSCAFQECSVVECSTSSMKIIIPFELGMTMDSVIRNMRISDATKTKKCLPHVNSTHAVFTVPLHDCNTQSWVEGDEVIYSNTIRYGAHNDETSVIIREYDHSYSARCRYQRRQSVSMKRLNSTDADGDEVAAMIFEEKSSGLSTNADALDTVQHYSSGDGVFEYRMGIYTDVTFSTHYNDNDYPLRKRLGERFFVGVSFVSQDEDLTVFIERCVALSASTIEETNEDARYLFINGGCPVDTTVQFHSSHNNTFSDRFSIESFKFNDAQYPYIYFRCDVVVCDTDEEDPACQRNCDSRRSAKSRVKRAASNHFRTRSQLVQGPIIVYEGDDAFRLENRRAETYISSVQRKEKELLKQGNKRREATPSSVWPIMIGVVCLGLGLVVGLFMQRKRNKAITRNGESQKPGEIECQEAMLQNC